MLGAASEGRVHVTSRASLGSDGLPPYESAPLGGVGGVGGARGYDAAELGLSVSSVGGTVEIEVPLSEQAGLSVFGDAVGGTVKARGGEMSVSGGAALGVGLRYGPIRFDWAINAQGRPKLHVGLTQD